MDSDSSPSRPRHFDSLARRRLLAQPAKQAEFIARLAKHVRSSASRFTSDGGGIGFDGIPRFRAPWLRDAIGWCVTKYTGRAAPHVADAVMDVIAWMAADVRASKRPASETVARDACTQYLDPGDPVPLRSALRNRTILKLRERMKDPLAHARREMGLSSQLEARA